MPLGDFSRPKSDREPPHSLEAEKSVLGACLLDNDAIDEVALWISEADFYRADHAELWTAILALRDAGKPADAVTLAEHLINRGRFEGLGGDEMLADLCGIVPHSANAAYYAGIVRELSVARQLLEASTETLEEIYSRQYTGPELIDRVEERIFRITDRAAVGSTITCKDLIDETFKRLVKLRDNRVVGLPTGYRDLDDLVGGLAPGQLVILAARPSVGKTALGLNIASHVAAEERGVLFISLEMSRQELGNRLISAYGHIPGGDLQKPWFIDHSRMDHVAATCDKISPFPLWIDDTPIRTVSQIQANARRVKHRSPQGLQLVVIDYLGLVNGQKAKGESRQEEVARVSRRLKAMARDLRVPVLCLHQLNRGIEHRDDKLPRMADLRESGQIEQDADMILLLHRPDQAKATERPGEADLIVAKNRNGATGTVTLAFIRAETRFDSFQPAAPPVSEVNVPAF